MSKIITVVVIVSMIFFTVPEASVIADTSITVTSELGAKVFKANCAGCHIKGGNIVRRGKNLKSKALRRNKVDTKEAIASLVTNGKGIMSAYGDKLSDTEIEAVSSYVLQRAAENWKQ
ncbi:MAG: c-type cytochrome [Cyanobacteria bacterium P01_G01_bin.39]